MDFSKGVLFDPGYSKHTVSFTQNIDAAYNVLLSIKSPHQRKFKFQMIYPQLLKLLEQTIAFYLGCLLWATFINQNFSETPKDILGNDYYGQKANDEEMLFEVNYIISYMDKLKKDCKYYLGKNCMIPTEWSEIMTCYKEFLINNKFLVETKTTQDIVLPRNIKKVSKEELDLILNQIKIVVSNGELKELFSIKNIILD